MSEIEGAKITFKNPIYKSQAYYGKTEDGGVVSYMLIAQSMKNKPNILRRFLHWFVLGIHWRDLDENSREI